MDDASAVDETADDETQLSRFVHASSQLLSLPFLWPADSPGVLAQEWLVDFVLSAVECYLQREAAGEWATDQLARMQRWIQRRLQPFLHIILLGREQDGA